MSVATTASLNVRNGAGTGNAVVTVIPDGAAVIVTGDPWYPVTFGGKSGWVSGKYLDFAAPEPVLTPAQQRFPSVAKRYLGCLYRWGGNGPDRFDCSGYTYWLLGDTGFVRGRTKTSANHQMQNFRSGIWKGTKVTGELKPGDLLCFGRDKNRATHIAASLGDGLLIGANHGGALVRTDADAIERGAEVCIEPVDYRGDLIEVWRPDYPALQS